ncbi:MAG: GNAT family N-acetyltransferase [Nitrospinaceae bacterium]|nr:GNAT family N-acetyltransferase [Nitrospinaceae bacterium]NIR53213.1 GNAT family N-acetyltransferase [Nitrospinaceae bacterium]NIS83608.1 GNAT family N-acetyltransferase [Nitrospinaceae bacterium]NIT80398.1 GNAT family N-acetyltransferase [Nitrospinaceae bacterium]NIU42741.1 GNAT family N-acetyltransferase [Nitrospinaceae bacterium]
MTIRKARESDFEAICAIFRAVVRTGDTYVFPPNPSPADVRANWMTEGFYTYVADREGRIVGTYILKPNLPGRGAHVANGSYMVDPPLQGRGIGRAMAEHSLEEARKLGFQAMQFNVVVTTNTPAIRLWQSLGFHIVGTVPRAFDHETRGQIDAHIMHRFL